MFNKENRLRSHEVAQVIKTGKFIGTRDLSARLQSGERARFAVVVSKKVAKSAVVRHYLRRQVFHGLRTYSALEIPVEAVMFVSKSYLEMDTAQKEQVLKELLLQIKAKSTTLDPARD